jgi:phospholipid/cholesterol/gamma-HCH transport system substrate-binding protein
MNMKREKYIQTTKVGIFTLLALVIITYCIFYIGSKQQAFGSKKELIVKFKNVSGLKTGNAVRFSGVTIGAIDKIEIISDSSVLVTLNIDENDSKFIKKDSKASISTEGLLGSKYIRISPGSPNGRTVDNGDQLSSSEPIDVEELLNTLTESGKSFKNITNNVDKLVTNIHSGEGMLGAMLSDTSMDEKMTQIVNSFGSTGRNSSILSTKMIEMVDTLKSAGANTVKISAEMEEFAKKLNNDSSTLGKFISDTAMANQINNTMVELKTTAVEVQETSSSVRESWLLNLFGKNKKKKKKK